MQPEIHETSTPDTIVVALDDEYYESAESEESGGNEEALPSRPILVRVFLSVSGRGSFRFGPLDTAKGDVSGFLARRVVRASARPAPGHRLELWTLNGQFAGTDGTIRVLPKAGLRVEARFEPIPDEEEESEGRGDVIDGWELNGPGDEDRSVAPSDARRVKFSNQRSSKFSVDMILDGSQLGSIGPGTSHTVSCRPNAKAAVRSGASAEPGQRASGAFRFTS